MWLTIIDLLIFVDFTQDKQDGAYQEFLYHRSYRPW